MGLLEKDSLLPVTANARMLAQSLKARQQPRTQLTGQGLLDTAAIGLSPVPVIGDVLGLAADANRFVNEPESRTPLNFGLAALGAIPFIPPLVSMGLGKFAQSQGKTLSAPSMSGPAKNQAGAIVYHGSPHKFDAFDSSKIGTGEGAQAYGHGLYFAENPSVAKQYQETLGDSVLKVDGKPFDPKGTDTRTMAVKSIAAQGWDNAMKATQQMLDNGADPTWMKNYIQDLNSLKKTPIKWETKGSLYKVDLPDEAIAKMLDYDAPLSQQKEALKQLGITDEGLQKIKMIGGNGDSVKSLMETLSATLSKNGGLSTSSNAAASDLLKSKGIPGIRYLDGGSRGYGEGTRNFVVFPGNEGLLKILERQ